jgi:hypothetical protein
VQRSDARHPLGQPSADQPAAELVLNLDVVMSLSPVVPDEQHQQRSLALDRSPSSRGKDRVALMDQCSDQLLVGTPSHQSSSPSRQSAGGTI